MEEGARLVEAVKELLAGALLAPALAFAQPPALDPETFLPPVLPWKGASEALVAPANDPWITPAERAGFRSTPTYDETLAYLRRLDSASNLIRLETIGRGWEEPAGSDSELNRRVEVRWFTLE